MGNERTAPLIVVIDDDIAYLRLMERLLTREGYRVTVLQQSSAAYELVAREQPSLVIVDVRMQNDDAGLAVLNLIRLDPETAAIPLLVCSADGVFLREKEAYLRERGCEILEKPFDLDDLLEKVRTALGRRA
jgi:CheY-like chemotaxis protein